MNNRLLPLVLRICAVLVTIAAIVLFIVQLRAATAANSSDIAWANLIVPLVLSLAMAVVMAGLAGAIDSVGGAPDETSRTLARIMQSQAELQHKMDDIAVSADRMSRNRLPPPPPPPMHVTAQLPTDALDPILRAISEVRELALLTDNERNQRLANMAQDRKRLLVREVIDHMERHRWSEGSRVLDTLDREHVNDLEVKRMRAQFDDARRNAEPATVARVREQVDNYIAIGAWDQALHGAQALCDDFAGNVDAQRLLARVTRERDIHIETSVARMVEEIRHDIDRRLWRRALMHAQRLVERFADHPKTLRITEQLATLQQNAEIEERQELEVRIQELIRSHKFSEAIELSEEMLARFPNSPQSEAIEQLLPRIRQLALEPPEPAAP